jgi:phthiodiolone/phenolphthiodiolone dimycocerosates ketoreductase
MTERRDLEIAVNVGFMRHLPTSSFLQEAAMLQGSGLVDYLQTYDQITGWLPRSLWKPEYVPAAAFLPDGDSIHDTFALTAAILAQNPEAGACTSTDAIRRGPVELAQTLLTLGTLTSGKVMVQIGAGEVRQVSPGGHKRSLGLKSLEDQLRYWRALWDAHEPISLEGNRWNLDSAYLGTQRPARQPIVWTVGGGPKLIDLTTSYADGVNVAIPAVQPHPESHGEWIRGVKAGLSEKDRDPEDFGFGGWPVMLCHEDENVIDRALDNPAVRWEAAIWGRFNNADWAKEGIQTAFPEDWHYSMRFLPMKTSAAETEEILGRTSREMAEKCMLHGTPEQLAEQLKPFIDQGVNWFSLTDFLPIVLDPEDGARTHERMLKIARILKDYTPNPTGTAATAAGA